MTDAATGGEMSDESSRGGSPAVEPSAADYSYEADDDRRNHVIALNLTRDELREHHHALTSIGYRLRVADGDIDLGATQLSPTELADLLDRR